MLSQNPSKSLWQHTERLKADKSNREILCHDPSVSLSSNLIHHNEDFYIAQTYNYIFISLNQYNVRTETRNNCDHYN